MLGPGQLQEQEEEEVSIRVLHFLPPRFSRSRRSFNHAPFSPDAILTAFSLRDAQIFRHEMKITSSE